MRKRFKIFLSTILLCAVSISFFGCGTEGTKNRSKKEIATAVMESQMKFPELESVYCIKKMADSSIVLLGEDKDYNFKRYISEDNGKTWTEKEVPEISDNSRSVIMASMSQEGKIAFEDCDKNALIQNSHCSLVQNASILNKDDSKSKINISGEDFDKMSKMIFAANGDIIVIIDTKLVEYDGNTGNIKYQCKLENNAFYQSICSVSNYIIALISSGKIVKYDLNTGKESGEIKKLEKYIVTGGNENYVFSAINNNDIFLASKNGVYKYSFSTDSAQQVIDGEKTIFGDRNMFLMQFIQIGENDFLAAYQDDKGKYEIYKYSYSKKLANTKLKQLNVYSLHTDYSVKEFIREYRKNHQNVVINYEVGVDDNGSIAKDDAIKKLNTEIMAGNGPDVLFLDGLSAEYYQKKGILVDITNIVDSKKDSLFNEIVNQYYTNKKIYMIPLSVKIPVIIGGTDVINGVKDYNTLAEAIESKLANQSDPIMKIIQPRDLVNLMYYTSTSKIIKNKKVDNQQLENFLDNTKKIYDIVNQKVTTAQREEYNECAKSFPAANVDEYAYSRAYYLDGSVQEVTNFLDPKSTKLEIGNAMTYQDIVSILSVAKSNGTIGYKEFSGDGENTFVPNDIVSINSKGKKKDLAKDFVSSMLDENYQNAYELTGLPINKISFSNLYKNQSYGGMTAIGIYVDGKEVNCNIVSPTQQEYDYLIGIMNKLDKPANMDTYMLGALTKGAENYVLGKYTKEQAVKYITKQIEIKLSE